MDLRKIIHELELEKQRLDEAIAALEKLVSGKSRRTRLSSESGFHFVGGQENSVRPDSPSPVLPAQSAGK